MNDYAALVRLGWRPFFQQQLSFDELNDCVPVRVIEQHKSQISVAGETAARDLPLLHHMPALVVGDWLLLDDEGNFRRLLERNTCFRRKAAGAKLDWQLISANVDTAFIVSSVNEDFNLNRIERYLALVHESGAEPVIVLSKSDLSAESEAYRNQVQSLDRNLSVETVNCLDSVSVDSLRPWLNNGETIAVLGSSGVGKSTLVNTLLGSAQQATGGIREDDDKGRHTTTRRSLIQMEQGGLLLDTPGMRELQLADCREGISSTFADIEALADQCRYADCQHQNEPGCAVKTALENEQLGQRRLDNYLKLKREEALNSSSLSEKRAKDKALGKFYKRTLSESHKLKGR